MEPGHGGQEEGALGRGEPVLSRSIGVHLPEGRFGSALGALAGVIIGGFLWNINYRFNEAKEDLSERTVASSYNRSLFDKVNAELVDIKLYLARGGRIPVEPYVPPTQRNTNGNEQPQDRIRQPAE